MRITREDGLKGIRTTQLITKEKTRQDLLITSDVLLVREIPHQADPDSADTR